MFKEEHFRDERYCPVTRFEEAPKGYEAQVRVWLEHPHMVFKAFGPEARHFQKTHRSERLRTMTFVAASAELQKFRPVCVSVDGADEKVSSWETLFAVVLSRLIVAQPTNFAAMQEAGLLNWMGCPPGGLTATELLERGTLAPEFQTLADVIARVQWLFLMCGIRLNEALVLVDPYDDATWEVRHHEIMRKRAADKAFMEGRKAAQKAWAAEHPFD